MSVAPATVVTARRLGAGALATIAAVAALVTVVCVLALLWALAGAALAVLLAATTAFWSVLESSPARR